MERQYRAKLASKSGDDVSEELRLFLNSAAWPKVRYGPKEQKVPRSGGCLLPKSRRPGRRKRVRFSPPVVSTQCLDCPTSRPPRGTTVGLSKLRRVKHAKSIQNTAQSDPIMARAARRRICAAPYCENGLLLWTEAEMPMRIDNVRFGHNRGPLSVFRHRRKTEFRGHCHQVGERVGLHFSHHLASVCFHSDLADAELEPNLFIQ